MIALVVSVLAAIVSGCAAVAAWRQRRYVQHLADRYAEAIGLVAIVARADPPVAAPEVRAACDRLLVAHGVEVSITGGRVH
jgi:hypothetical protein